MNYKTDKKYEEYYYQLADKDNRWTEGRGKNILNFIKEHLAMGQSILEIGCGTGGIAKYLPKGVSYTGIDISNFAITRACKLYKNKTTRFIRADIDNFSFEEQQFDLILGVFTIEHLRKPKIVLQRVFKALRSGGYLILVAPNLELPVSYPSALRHKGPLYRYWFFLLRFCDYFLRLFGVYSFRTIRDSFIAATGRYEKADDDLVYLASSYEIINFLKKLGMRVIQVDFYRLKRKSFRALLKKLITFLPAMKYYGVSLFVIMQKRSR